MYQQIYSLRGIGPFVINATKVAEASQPDNSINDDKCNKYDGRLFYRTHTPG